MALVSAAVAAVDPARLVTASLGSTRASGRRLWVLAVGKAAVPMARACLATLGNRVCGGVVITPGPAIGASGPLRWIEGSHPVPDAKSVEAGRAALALARSVGELDGLLVLLSGGASALMALPAEGVTLEAKQGVTRRLLAASATIDEVNCVRKHLSRVKGGRLAMAARGPVATLALSDVVGDDPSVIGSGPTVADPSTFAQALAILDSRGGTAAFPRDAVDRLQRGARGEIAETPKPGDVPASHEFTVIGSGAVAARGAAAAAEARGFAVQLIEEPVVGEARQAAGLWLGRVRAIAAGHDGPLCVVSRGETTVHVRGPGRGGRNQEFALALVSELAEMRREVVVASVGTDGVDGPTDAAGALADSTAARRATALGLEPLKYLETNDAWSFFDALGDLVRTGPTGTNVGDVQVAVLGARR